MDNLVEDQKVVDLLTKLKHSNGGYPSDMLAARRRTYLRQMANVGLGIGIGTSLKATLKGGSNGSGVATTVTGKILEIALVAAITLEAGTAAYLYREKIAHVLSLFNSGATAHEVASPSTSNETNSSNPSLIEAVGTPFATLSPTPTGTLSATSSTAVAADNNQSSNNNDSANSDLNANATPNPGGNQGNQYGLTPKPDRNKDNNGGGDGNSQDNGGGGGGSNTGNGGSNSNKP